MCPDDWTIESRLQQRTGRCMSRVGNGIVSHSDQCSQETMEHGAFERDKLCDENQHLSFACSKSPVLHRGWMQKVFFINLVPFQLANSHG